MRTRVGGSGRRARRTAILGALVACAVLASAGGAQAATLHPIENNTYFANVPDGVVIGNVHNGWKMVVERYSNDGNFVYGRIYGSGGLAKCGWLSRWAVLVNQSAGSVDPYPGCGGGVGDPGNAFNSYSGSGITDGTYIGPKSCAAFENISGNGSGHGIGLTSTSGAGLFYRYTTNDGQFAMVRDAGRSGNNWLFVSRSCVGTSATTYPEFYVDLALQSHANGQYVAAEGGGGHYLIANRGAIGPWERFRVHGQLTDGQTVALQAYNGQFVVAEWGGGSAVNVNRNAIGPWERFMASKRNGGGQIGPGDWVAFRTYDGVHWLCAESWGSDRINATRTGVGQWETFTAHWVSRGYP